MFGLRKGHYSLGSAKALETRENNLFYKVVER